MSFPRYDRVPSHMESALKKYVETGRLHGDFLRAVMENNLVEAYGSADLKNRDAMEEWTMCLFNDIPASCWGDEETVNAWIESGGLEGKENNDIPPRIAKSQSASVRNRTRNQ